MCRAARSGAIDCGRMSAGGRAMTSTPGWLPTSTGCADIRERRRDSEVARELASRVESPSGGRLARGATPTSGSQEDVMKEGLRFVDCDMHIMEPPDLFEKYLDPKFRSRVILPIGADG